MLCVCVPLCVGMYAYALFSRLFDVNVCRFYHVDHYHLWWSWFRPCISYSMPRQCCRHVSQHYLSFCHWGGGPVDVAWYGWVNPDRGCVHVRVFSAYVWNQIWTIVLTWHARRLGIQFTQPVRVPFGLSLNATLTQISLFVTLRWACYSVHSAQEKC